MQGRRLPDTDRHSFPEDWGDLREGDYWKVLDDNGEPEHSDLPTNLTGTVWMFMAPNRAGIGTLRAHTVREHEDGTISVRPGDGSSNSIMQISGYSGQDWHGYVEHGVWTAC